MNVSVFGLGYVGCISAACLARDGHKVAGVDVSETKIELINSGKSPIIEPGLADLIQAGIESGSLYATSNTREAIAATDISLVCVGTPSRNNGNLDLGYIENVSREIGSALAMKSSYHVVVIRSTVLPSTVKEKVIPILERCSGKKLGEDFGVCMNPEFLREGTALKDYDHPSLIVIGGNDEKSSQMIEALYSTIDAPVVHTSLGNAEMLKYMNNAFHALKISFANEVGRFCKEHEVDGQEIMALLCQDTQLNISPAYLRPGFAFGGSCLPKDVRALNYRAKERDLDLPLLGSILPSNQTHLQSAVEMIEATGKKKIAVLGLSFKADTDDLRESPMLTMVERLLGKGYKVRVYDEQVELSRLMGANKAYLEQGIPHVTELMGDSLEQMVDCADVVVVTKNSKGFKEAVSKMRSDQVLIDLTGGVKELAAELAEAEGISYEGIGW